MNLDGCEQGLCCKVFQCFYTQKCAVCPDVIMYGDSWFLYLECWWWGSTSVCLRLMLMCICLTSIATGWAIVGFWRSDGRGGGRRTSWTRYFIFSQTESLLTHTPITPQRIHTLLWAAMSFLTLIHIWERKTSFKRTTLLTLFGASKAFLHQ